MGSKRGTQLCKQERLQQAVDDLCITKYKDSIYSFCEKGELQEAVKQCLHCNGDGICDSDAYARLLQGCIDHGASMGIEIGQKIHTHMLINGFKVGIFIGNRLIDMYTKCGSMAHARQVFDEMPVRNVFSWNSMIAGYVKLGSVEVARQLFDKMPQRNLVSWNTMIAGFSQNGYGNDALQLFCQMQRANVKPDRINIVGVVNACASVAAVKQGKQLHGYIVRSGLMNVVVNNAFVDMYAKCECLEDARLVFDTMPEQNVVSWTSIISGFIQSGKLEIARQLFDEMLERNKVSWNALIAGYAQQGYAEEALKLFGQMLEADVKPNHFTFVSVLSACASLAALNRGMQVHDYIIRTRHDFSIFMGNGLVDMYAKCGSTVNAQKLFDQMAERDVVSWNAMILGYAQNGCGKIALQLFEKMLDTNMKPNEITFLGVLSACSHAGLVDEGHYYFSSMSQQHSITPRASHYAIMIDILGRSGRIDEAEHVIDNAPFEPSASMWRALLGTCWIHGNTGLAKRAAESLCELEPQNASQYVVLSNLYAAARMWDRVAEVRKLMKERRVKKMPGCSWIEVKNRLHTFVAEDRSRNQTMEFYSTLE